MPRWKPVSQTRSLDTASAIAGNGAQGLQESAPRLRHPDADQGANEISKRPNPIKRLITLWHFRELLVNLVRKELRVKYKSSVLGFAWSMLNPALYIVVFSFVFILLGNNVKHFALFMMAGLLPWNFFVASVTGGTGSIVNNAPLVTKVWFPREVLPISVVGASLVHFVLQGLVLVGALLVFRQLPSGAYSLSLIPAMLGLVVFTAAVTIACSAVDVYLRDMQHLVELLTLAWFWGTPVVYQVTLVTKKLAEHGISTSLVYINPLTAIVVPFQRALYNTGLHATFNHNGTLKSAAVLPNNGVLWYVMVPTIMLGCSLALLAGALWLFSRLEDNMAEEI